MAAACAVLNPCSGLYGRCYLPRWYSLNNRIKKCAHILQNIHPLIFFNMRLCTIFPTPCPMQLAS